MGLKIFPAFPYIAQRNRTVIKRAVYFVNIFIKTETRHGFQSLDKFIRDAPQSCYPVPYFIYGSAVYAPVRIIIKGRARPVFPHRLPRSEERRGGTESRRR